MYLANKMFLAKALSTMCLDCNNKDTDCLIVKIGKCPFKEGTCKHATVSLWTYLIDENTSKTDTSQLDNAIATLQTSASN